MELSINARIKRSRAFKELPVEKLVAISDTHEAYTHLTFVVDNLFDYLKIIKMITGVKHPHEALVFRGMSNSEWLPIPSLSRYTGYDETIEYTMVNEFLTLRPEAFDGLKSNFEILSKMQHYGLPTRLLDFTTNSLVALFFACSGSSKNDARVLCASTVLADSRDDIVESICSSHLNYSVTNLRLEDLLNSVGLPPFKYFLKLYLQKEYRPLFVKPLYWNQRIINQKAVFLVFPNTLFDLYGKRACYNEFPDIENNEYNKIKAISEHEQLEKIYPKIYPKLRYSKAKVQIANRDFYVSDQSMKKLMLSYDRSKIIDFHTYKYTELGELLFERRFLLHSDIQSIDKKSMEKEFCSIIIDKKAKKEILKDLESIGIDRAFIYPELEYTAEKIKNIYWGK